MKDLEKASDWYNENDVTLSRTAEKFDIDYRKLYEYVTEERTGIKIGEFEI